MDQLQLHITYDDSTDPPQSETGESLAIHNYQLDLRINGRSLLEWVRAIEQTFPTKERTGDYQNLPPAAVLLPARKWLPVTGESLEELLICHYCGDYGCWPIECRIIVEPERVIWRDFRQPHRPGWSYAGLGPFVFGRTQYEAELSQLLTDEPYQAAWRREREYTQQLWGEYRQEQTVAWAEAEPDIRAVVLVGSWARGEMQLDSDLDLLLLVAEPARFRDFANWPPEMQPERWQEWRDAEYGMVWSRHIQTIPGLETEFSFAPLTWAETAPVDSGTVRVIRDGYRILYDPDGRLARLAAAVNH